jgi:hypothetical protein
MKLECGGCGGREEKRRGEKAGAEKLFGRVQYALATTARQACLHIDKTAVTGMRFCLMVLRTFLIEGFDLMIQSNIRKHGPYMAFSTIAHSSLKLRVMGLEGTISDINLNKRILPRTSE